MTDYPIKATSREITKTPFYLVQTNGLHKRFVIWLCDKFRIRTLIAGFINRANLIVNVRVIDFDETEEGVDYSGLVSKSELHRLMTKYEDVLFHNGYHDLMIRIPETDELLVFEEHGLIFIYSSDSAWKDTLRRLGADYLPNEKLIYELDHWHYCLPEGRKQLLSFMEELKLKKD